MSRKFLPYSNFYFYRNAAVIVIAKISFRLITKVNQDSNSGFHDITNGNYMMF